MIYARKLFNREKNERSYRNYDFKSFLAGLPKWVAVGLDVLGAGAIGFGIYQNSQAASHKKDYKDIPKYSKDNNLTPQSEFDSAYKKVESSRDMRNIGYIAGGVLLLGGVSLHIFF